MEFFRKGWALSGLNQEVLNLNYLLTFLISLYFFIFTCYILFVVNEGTCGRINIIFAEDTLNL